MVKYSPTKGLFPRSPCLSLATNFSGGFHSITQSVHYPDKSISPSALEGHGLTPGMLKLGMAWL